MAVQTTIKAPTDEQLKEFWKWCGFKYARNGSTPLIKDLKFYTAPNVTSGGVVCLPPINLNNLFKYAVNNLEWFIGSNGENIVVARASKTAHSPHHEVKLDVSGRPKDEITALALFWAIWEVIKGGKS